MLECGEGFFASNYVTEPVELRQTAKGTEGHLIELRDKGSEAAKILSIDPEAIPYVA